MNLLSLLLSIYPEVELRGNSKFNFWKNSIWLTLDFLSFYFGTESLIMVRFALWSFQWEIPDLLKILDVILDFFYHVTFGK